MLNLLWAEFQKLRRSSIVFLTVFATVMVAAVVLVCGKSMNLGGLHIDDAGWYMTMVQPWATLFVIPAIIALLGSYMICREEQDDTIKSLRLIPVDEVKLTVAKMIISFAISILVYLLLFVITLVTEMILHFSELSADMALGFLKTYLLEGIGVFMAVSPIIAFVSYTKKNYWLALMLAEIYSFAGIFMSMSDTLRTFYPITAVMGLAGYYETTAENLFASAVVLLVCGCLSVFLVVGLNNKKRGKLYG